MNLAPWLRILDEAGKRNESQLNALINEYEGIRDSENVARVIKVKRIIAEKSLSQSITDTRNGVLQSVKITEK